uniref:Cyclin-dependent protein kinase inhibitor SMR1-like n=1 Tax=Rhizophora mucronata TaxID=61149 RepID=A0A2P2II39_RHIMU
MSTVLESRRDLAKIRVIPVETESEALKSCSVADEEDNNAIRRETSAAAAADDDNCKTPTSEEQKIPAILSCPPAPRKPRMAVSCKRKLSELDFFENVNRGEVESFFRSSFEVVAKRRCPCD